MTDEPWILLCPYCFKEIESNIEYRPVGIHGEEITCPNCKNISYIYEDEVEGDMVHILFTRDTWINLEGNLPND